MSRYQVSLPFRFPLIINVEYSMAYAELYLTISRIFRTFDMEIRGTVPEDLVIRHIRLTGYPEKGLGEVKAVITGKVA